MFATEEKFRVRNIARNISSEHFVTRVKYMIKGTSDVEFFFCLIPYLGTYLRLAMFLEFSISTLFGQKKMKKCSFTGFFLSLTGFFLSFTGFFLSFTGFFLTFTGFFLSFTGLFLHLLVSFYRLPVSFWPNNVEIENSKNMESLTYVPLKWLVVSRDIQDSAMIYMPQSLYTALLTPLF